MPPRETSWRKITKTRVGFMDCAAVRDFGCAVICYCCTLLKTNGRAHLMGLLPVFSNSFDTFGSRGLRLSERLWDEDVRRSRMKRDL